jgi:hypothetical protein
VDGELTAPDRCPRSLRTTLDGLAVGDDSRLSSMELEVRRRRLVRFAVAGLIFAVLLPSCGSSTTAPQSIDSQPTARFRVEVVKSWVDRFGGVGRAAYVDPFDRTETNCSELGRQLWQETKNDKVAYVWVYDRESDAARHAPAECPLQSDVVFCDMNTVALYSRNDLTGWNVIEANLVGNSGRTTRLEVR